MKNITNKDLEMLSAYLDGELSEEEVLQIENLLIESNEFAKEYQELKRVKSLTEISYPTLQEAQFFETRLMQKINSDNVFLSKLIKWSPAIGFSVLAILLMVVLKLNPAFLDKIIETPKSTIAGFYKQNLQPLLYAADLTNEDIFNFAFYKQLPLDKAKNQFIVLGTDSTGKEYFEINKSGKIPDENNLNRFVTALNLTNEQKISIDSIIGSYAEELQSQILVNENNTVAINSNLWNYNKALTADIVAFASANKSRELVKIIPAGLNKLDTHSINIAVKQIKEAKNDDYIFMTPDTIFSEKFQFDKKKFRKDMDELKKNLEKMKSDLKKEQFNFNFNSDSIYTRFNKDSLWENNFKVTFDSSMLRVRIPKIVLPNYYFNSDSFLTKIQLDKITENLKELTFEMPKGFPFKGGDFKIKYSEGDSVRNYQFKMNAINIDSIIKNSLRVLDTLQFRMPKNFNFNLDSLQLEKLKKLNYLNYDSIYKLNKIQSDKQMRKNEKKKKILEDLEYEKEKRLKKTKSELNPDTVKT